MRAQVSSRAPVRHPVTAVRRVLAGTMLLALVSWGISARDAATSATSGLRIPVLAVLVGLCLAVAVVMLLAALHLPRRRRREQAPEPVLAMPWSSRDRLLSVLTVLLMLAVAVLVFVGALRVGGAASGRAGPGGGRSVHLPGLPPMEALPAGAASGLIVVGVVVVLLALVAAFAVSSRRRLARGAVATEFRAAPLRPAPEAGMGGGVDARADAGRRAVVASYRAFEAVAEQRGIPVAPPETAAEIGALAVTAAVAPPEAVQELTALFHRARYSSQLIGAAEADRAAALLAQLRRDMGRSP